MFKRRREHTNARKFRELFWPSMGWGRAALYAKHRIIRLSASTHSIAAGLVCGMVVSFTPFFGFHFVLALALARLTQGNYLASIVGTFFGNPWTFPVLLWTSFETGSSILRGLDSGHLIAQSNPANIDEIHSSTLGFLSRSFWDLYLPTALGSLVCIVVFWPLFYGPVYYLVRMAQSARQRRTHRKWLKKNRQADENLETGSEDV